MSTGRADDDTVEFPAAKLGGMQFFAKAAEPIGWRFGSLTHPGKVRANNEDHYAIIRRTRTREVLASNVALPNKPIPDADAYFLVIADGMGGEPFGEFASALAIKTAWEWAGRAASWVMKFRGIEAQQVQERVDAFAKVIQAEMVSNEDADPRLTGMGTTWTSAYIMNRDVVIAHLGDSRAYLCQPRGMTQITRDHTLAAELVDEGAQPEDVVRFRSVLTRSLGGQEGDTHPDVSHVRIEIGDRLLLCSDGLTDAASAAEIARIMASEADPQRACERLVEQALAAGGPDNITVLVAHAVEAG